MTFTNFCCRSGGSNLNAGTRTGDTTVPGTSADVTYPNGNWNGTDVFTVASGNPLSDGVAVGDFASVYADGATTTTLIGRVTDRTSTTITLSTTAKSGSTGSGTGNRTLKIGGAWSGPSTSESFPFGFITSAAVNGNSDPVKVNMSGTFTIASTITNNQADLIVCGYGSAYGDGTLATIDGGATGTSYTLWAQSGARTWISHIEFKNNGNSGTAQNGISWTQINGVITNCVVRDVRLNGILTGSSADNLRIEECEFYNCNQSNGSGGGVRLNIGLAATYIDRCLFYNNNGSGVLGSDSGSAMISNSVFANNTADGINTRFGRFFITNCDFYANGSDGFESTEGGVAYFTNCNFIDNGGYGILGAGGTYSSYGAIRNCGFGSGTMANTSGDTFDLRGTEVVGSITYPANQHPYADPANGDFTIVLDAAKNVGHGGYLQTQSGKSGTVATLDIGAAQAVFDGGIVPSQVQVS